MEKKIVVPEGMLEVVVRYLATHGGRACAICEGSGIHIKENGFDASTFSVCPSCLGRKVHPHGFRETARGVLEAALLWLSTDNGVSPTMEESRAMWETKKRFPFEPFEWVRWGASEWVRSMFFMRSMPDDQEMTVYDCLDCRRSWRQQLRENVESCVYCQSVNTKPVATVSAVRFMNLVPQTTNGTDEMMPQEPQVPDDGVHCGKCGGTKGIHRPPCDGKAPSPAAQAILSILQGVTPTAAEADSIFESLRTTAHGWQPK